MTEGACFALVRPGLALGVAGWAWASSDEGLETDGGALSRFAGQYCCLAVEMQDGKGSGSDVRRRETWLWARFGCRGTCLCM